MRDFLQFARLACDNKKTFILSHSSLQTSYASTMETADYLLQQLQLPRKADTSIQVAGLKQISGAAKGRFVVLGFAGDTGSDHMQHLHHIDLLWDRVVP